MSVEHAENLITIELPRDASSAIAETPEAVAKELRLAAAIELYREGRLSQDEGAGIAGLSQPDFGSALEARLRLSSSPGESSGDLTPPVPELAEVHYQRLERWKGPDASAEAQVESRQFWRESGLAGIAWLVARVRDESQDDRLRGAASMLADLGPASLGPILDTLQDQPTSDQALALLWAVGWLGDRHETADSRVEVILVQYLFDEDPELQEAAARALRVIPPARAKVWLTRRLRDESDREVRLTIEDELELSGTVGEQRCTS